MVVTHQDSTWPIWRTITLFPDSDPLSWSKWVSSLHFLLFACRLTHLSRLDPIYWRLMTRRNARRELLSSVAYQFWKPWRVHMAPSLPSGRLLHLEYTLMSKNCMFTLKTGSQSGQFRQIHLNTKTSLRRFLLCQCKYTRNLSKVLPLLDLSNWCSFKVFISMMACPVCNRTLYLTQIPYTHTHFTAHRCESFPCSIGRINISLKMGDQSSHTVRLFSDSFTHSVLGHFLPGCSVYDACFNCRRLLANLLLIFATSLLDVLPCLRQL